MRIRICELLASVLLLAGCRALLPAAPTEPTRTPTPEITPRASEISTDRQVFAAGLDDSQLPALSALPGASVYHIDLSISADLQTVVGTEEILYTNTEDVPLDQMAIHLLPNLIGGEMLLSVVRVGGEAVEPTYGDSDGAILVAMAPPLSPGDSTVMQIDFQVRVPQDLELNYGVLAAYQGVLAYAHGYPMVAVYDEDGWNLDMPPPYGDITYADASFYVVRVRAPADLVLCGSGVEISRSEADGQQDVTLAAGPARDFYLAGSRDYQPITRSSGGITLRVCATAAMLDRAQQTLEIADRTLRLFGELYAPYPYTKLDIVATPNLALGIEYPGAFALNELLLTPEEDFGGTPEAALLESVAVHEAAHEWFYNLVGNDQLEDPWLDEALAQYATLRYYAERYGDSGAAGMRDSFYSRWERVGRERIPIGLPVADYGEAAYGAIIYGRGPLFLEALEQRMGRLIYDQFLREYTAAFAWEEAGPQDFRSLAEAACDCDLGDLFTEWVD